jgi:hypothetical protein
MAFHRPITKMRDILGRIQTLAGADYDFLKVTSVFLSQPQTLTWPAGKIDSSQAACS